MKSLIVTEKEKKVIFLLHESRMCIILMLDIII